MVVVLGSSVSVAGPAFARSGSARLEVVVAGLPPNASASVRVRGPQGFTRQLRGSKEFSGVTAGVYHVQVSPVVLVHGYRSVSACSEAFPSLSHLTVLVQRGGTGVAHVSYGTIRSAAAVPLRTTPSAASLGRGSAEDRAATSPELSSGAPLAWGDNNRGQLGDGTMISSDVPVSAGELGGMTAASGGDAFSMALLSNGTVVAWGDNDAGELGDGTTTSSDVPVAVSGLTGVTAISAGSDHALALLGNGTVVAWGYNALGQLGNGTTTSSDVPLPVSGLSGVIAVSAGNNYSSALLSNGTVMVWGDNESGVFGNGTTTSSDVPVAVPGLSEVKAFAAGYSTSTALLDDGTVMDWGDNGQGQLGNGNTTSSNVPVAVTGLSGVTAVARGTALLGNGTVMDWGVGESGQLGDDSTESSDVPVAVSGLSGVTAIASGLEHRLALLSNGTVMAWGANDTGQLGDGNRTDSTVPVTVSGLTGAIAVAAGRYHSLAVGPPRTRYWYRSGVELQQSLRLPVISWGGAEDVAQTSGSGQISCRTVGAGTIENPVGGGPGVGQTQASGFFECSAPQCEAAGAEKGIPAIGRITSSNFPWKDELTEGGSPNSIREKIGVPFSMFGSPEPGEMVRTVSCETPPGYEPSIVLFSETLEGQLEPEIGAAAAGTLNGTSASKPAGIRYAGSSSGALHAQLGGEATSSGMVKYMGYNGQEILTVK